MLTTTLWDRFNFFWFLGSVVRDTFGFQKSFKVKKKTKVAVCVSKNTSGGGRTHDLPLRRRMPYPFGHGGGIAENGFDPLTFGLWAQRASAAPLCFAFCMLFGFKMLF